MCYPEYLPPHRMAEWRLQVLMDRSNQLSDDIPNDTPDDVINNEALDLYGPDVDSLRQIEDCQLMIEGLGLPRRAENPDNPQPSQIDNSVSIGMLRYAMQGIRSMKAGTKLLDPPFEVMVDFLCEALPVRLDLSCWLAEEMIGEIADVHGIYDEMISVNEDDPTALVCDPDVQGSRTAKAFSRLEEDLKAIPLFFRAFSTYTYEWIALRAQEQMEEMLGDRSEEGIVLLVGRTKVKYVYFIYAMQIVGWRWFDLPWQGV
ncbi:MAG: hypothetical protein M1812_000965 [Candelaria pacifica]|nr:MAG: hypothetical protein M1812_000965 [Candelaria pacifica]